MFGLKSSNEVQELLREAVQDVPGGPAVNTVCFHAVEGSWAQSLIVGTKIPHAMWPKDFFFLKERGSHRKEPVRVTFLPGGRTRIIHQKT